MSFVVAHYFGAKGLGNYVLAIVILRIFTLVSKLGLDTFSIRFIASFAKLLNIELKNNEARDSRNTLDAFIGKDQKGLKYTLQEANRTVAIREGNWKYIPGKKNAQLYNLSEDIGERNNMISKKPQLAKSLAAKLTKLRSSKGLRN